MKKRVRKEQIWKEPKYKSLVIEGLDGDLLFYIRGIYEATFTASPKNCQKEYISFVKHVKNVVENLTRTDMIKGVAVKKLLNKYGVWNIEDCGNINHKYNKFITKKFFKAVKKKIYEVQMLSDSIGGRDILGCEITAYRRIQMVKITYNSDDGYYIPVTWNENKKFVPVNIKQIKKGDWIVFDRSKPLKPVQIFSNRKDAEAAYKKTVELLRKRLESAENLNKCVRIDEEIDKNSNKTIKNLKNDFNLKKEYFGSKIDKNGQENIIKNLYNSLNNLAKVLHVRRDRVLFKGKLKFAFDVKIPKYCCALCIPDSDLITMSAEFGAGNLAHEWAHYFDSVLGTLYDAKEGYLSDLESDENPLKEMADVMKAIKYKRNGKQTRFYKESLREDKECFMKLKEGEYWSINTEMFARAFAMYVRERLGKEDKFLVRNREINIHEPRFTTKEKNRVYACFDKMMKKVKKLDIM